MPYIHVKILAGTPLPLTYFANQDISLGTLVRVPLRGATATGVVVATNVTQPQRFEAKPIIGIEPFPADPNYQAFLEQLAQHYQLDQATLLARLRTFLAQKDTNV